MSSWAGLDLPVHPHGPLQDRPTRGVLWAVQVPCSQRHRWMWSPEPGPEWAEGHGRPKPRALPHGSPCQAGIRLR